jgi:hypothetical protein
MLLFGTVMPELNFGMVQRPLEFLTGLTTTLFPTLSTTTAGKITFPTADIYSSEKNK